MHTISPNSSLRTSLVNDANIVFQSPLAEWQKLHCFRKFLFPRVFFALRVVFLGSTWCKRLDTSLRGIIKKGLHLPLLHARSTYIFHNILEVWGFRRLRMSRT